MAMPCSSLPACSGASPRTRRKWWRWIGWASGSGSATGPSSPPGASLSRPRSARWNRRAPPSSRCWPIAAAAPRDERARRAGWSPRSRPGRSGGHGGGHRASGGRSLPGRGAGALRRRARCGCARRAGPPLLGPPLHHSMTDWTIASLAAAIRARRISPVEATQECLARVARLDGRLRAFITVDADGALARARALEAEAAAGLWRGPLHGVPLAHKDLFHIGGLPTSCGTKTAEYFFAERDATAVARLIEAGANTLGKLNMAELALGPFGDNAHHGDAQNPWRAGHVSGGSSSGSAVAVAVGLALGALGTDTGGSIRLPAACCGIVGLKPTYGRVSRAGAMPLSWAMDHIGPMARTVADVALMLEVIAGPDPADATSSAREVPGYLAELERPPAGLRVALPENYYLDGVSAEVAAATRDALAAFERLG